MDCTKNDTPIMNKEEDSQEVQDLIAMKQNCMKNAAQESENAVGMGLRSCPEIRRMLDNVPMNLKILQFLYAELLIRVHKLWSDKGSISEKLESIQNLISNTVKYETYPRDFHYIFTNQYKGMKCSKLESEDIFCTCHPTCVEQKCYGKLTKQMYKDLTVFFHQRKGWGVKTLAPLCKGEFIVEICGRVWPKKKSTFLDESYLVQFGNCMIYCKKYTNIGGLVNHSCKPNSELRKFIINGVERVGLFALREINTGEEITFKYSTGLTFACDCGEVNCSSKKSNKIPDQEKKK